MPNEQVEIDQARFFGLGPRCKTNLAKAVRWYEWRASFYRNFYETESFLQKHNLQKPHFRKKILRYLLGRNFELITSECLPSCRRHRNSDDDCSACLLLKYDSVPHGPSPGIDTPAHRLVQQCN